ncbi:signal peptidase I [Candidatus Woesearchaeota archaeon]|jgi:signal peptidase I|nr:signal peptidase I [Candidatus Woesearchaeota archaeon]MDP6648306.1 signal peptidase I [Candidatus Woesearchaeota archaeon]|tara:strand:- start:4552 stop:5193 length:642 start_codon:yes stop_codon:yes gene_type:complete
MKDWKMILRKVWHFIWEDNSIWSWIINIILAFILIKFIVYPGLGFAFQTSHPVVAVVSESMEHKGSFDEWWNNGNKWYVANGISRGEFEQYPLKNGFNKGDIMVLYGKKTGNIGIGDVVVFWSSSRDPIIHRIVKKSQDNGAYIFQTKGDNYRTNPAPIQKPPFLDETRITEDQIIGNAVFKVPLLGWIKIWFNDYVWVPILKPLLQGLTIVK